MPDFYIGADLGQTNDYTAVTIARRETVKTIHGLVPLVLPDLPPEIVARLAAHLDDPQTFGAPLNVKNSLPLEKVGPRLTVSQQATP